MLELSALTFYHTYLNDKLPLYFYSFKIATQGSQHNHNTRHKNCLIIARTRTLYADKRLKLYLPRLLNKTSSSILDNIATHSLAGFSSYIKIRINQTYEEQCSVPNCYVCHS